MYTAQEMVEKLRSGTEVEAVTAQLYGQYQRSIREQARKRGIRPDDINDLVQEVMIAFLRNVRAGRFEPRSEGSLSRYLSEIARNLTFKNYRGEDRRDRREEEYQHTQLPPPTPEDLMMERDYIEQSWEIFRRLCTVCQRILTAYYRDEMPMAEIARVHDLGTADAVKVRKFRCIKELKGLLGL